MVTMVAINAFKWVNAFKWQGKMTFPHVSAKLRTDFASMIDEDHHLSRTPSPLVGVVKMVTLLKN